MTLKTSSVTISSEIGRHTLTSAPFFINRLYNIYNKIIGVSNE